MLAKKEIIATSLFVSIRTLLLSFPDKLKEDDASSSLSLSIMTHCRAMDINVV